MPSGTLLYTNTDAELMWPSATNNAYVATGAPIFAAVDSRGDTVALGPYDSATLFGRPAREIVESPFRLRQSTWVLPPSPVATAQVPTARGIQIDQEIIGGPEAPDGLLFRLTFTNVTDQVSYVLADPGARLQHIGDALRYADGACVQPVLESRPPPRFGVVHEL